MSDKQSIDAIQLRRAGLRPTYQRLALVKFLRESGLAHFTAAEAFRRAREMGARLSQATVYNTLNDLVKARILQRVDLRDKAWFCARPAQHHHFFDTSTGRLFDIPDPQPAVIDLPAPPIGFEIEGIDLVIRLRRTDDSVGNNS